MAELNHEVVNSEGKAVGTITLDPTVFGAPVKTDLVHQVVRWQRAKRRAGTHACLNRGAMTGGGKKPWKQKGTGNARAGSRNSPVWVGGAVAHGPSPRSYEFKLTKGVRRGAMTSVLSDKLKNESLVILDNLAVESGKTRDMTAILSNLGVAGKKAVLLMPEKDELVWRSSGNLKEITSLPVAGANVYDMVNAHYIVATKDAVEKLQQRLTKNSK